MPTQAQKSTADVHVPRHVAIIMDGNGRWAKERGKPRHSGHRAGVSAVKKAVEAAAESGVGFLTLFAFSSENWSRPQDEVSRLMSLFVEALRREVDELHRSNVRLRFVGALQQLSKSLQAKIAEAEAKTANSTGLQLNVAIAYGGRWDIVNASKALSQRVLNGELAIDDISEQQFAAAMRFGFAPDPDLLIRTGGEQRVSNFMLWNLAYAELCFLDILWPDFDKQCFTDALQSFASKQRRYGHTGDQVEAAKC